MSSNGSSIGDKPLSQGSQASSQDSVTRVVQRFMAGSQEEPGTSSSGHYLAPGPGGLGGDSQIFQTANHFELEDGVDHREQVEYTISHRVDVSPVRMHYSQAPYSQPQPFQPSQFEGPFYTFGSSTQSAHGIGELVPAPLIGANRMPISLCEPSSYGFKITFEPEQQPVPKSAAQTYVPSLQKLIIKKDARCTIPFSFDKRPPEGSQIRVMVVYKVPVMLSEGVQCCAEHIVSESKEVGGEKAPHFVKSLDRDAIYLSPCRRTDRYAVIVPLASMHRVDPSPDSNSPIKYIGVFRFPCYTSNLPRPARGVGVQLLFGLEVPYQSAHFPVARFAVDARVCASPGRDRDGLMAAVQEAHPSTSSSPSGGGDTSPQPQGGRKRRAPSPIVSHNIAVSCSSTKRSKLGLEEDEGQDGLYTLMTPYKDVYEMLNKIKSSLELTRRLSEEQIRQATKAGLVLPGFSPPPPQSVSGDDMPSTSQAVLSWLQSIGMERCHGAFEQMGVVEMSQVQSVTAEELRKRGVAQGDVDHLLESRPTSSTASSAPSQQIPSPTSIPDTQPGASTQPTPDTQAIPDSQVSLVATEAQVTHRIEFRMRRTITKVLDDLVNGPTVPMDED